MSTQEFGSFTEEDIKVARNVICPQAANKPPAPDSIIRLLLHRCAQLGCDPYSRMIYAVERKGVWGIQASIDLFRATAESSGGYAGQDGPYFCGDDGKWVDVWLDKKPPRAAKVGIYRTGFAAPLYAIANWEAYAQAPDQGWSMWNKMPALMLSKCAEALAIRKSFPAKLAGLYTADEMMQADNAALPLPKVALPSATQAATIPAAILLPQSEIELNAVKAMGRQVGRLSGQVQNDLQRLEGDVLALKAEYETALSAKNPRGPEAAKVAVPSPATKQQECAPTDNEPAVGGEAGILVRTTFSRDENDEMTPTHEVVESPARTPEQNLGTAKDLDLLRNAAVDATPIPGHEAPASEKTQAVMAVMTHAGFEKALPQYNDKMTFCSKVVGREITAWSQLTPGDCANVLARLNMEYKAEPAGELATDSEIVQLQIQLKDAEFVSFLKKSKVYAEAQEAGQTQADSLRIARLTFVGRVLGHSVESFKELTSAEVQTLFAKFQSMKSA